jgi:hypothetical protein
MRLFHLYGECGGALSLFLELGGVCFLLFVLLMTALTRLRSSLGRTADAGREDPHATPPPQPSGGTEAGGRRTNAHVATGPSRRRSV